MIIALVLIANRVWDPQSYDPTHVFLMAPYCSSPQQYMALFENQIHNNYEDILFVNASSFNRYYYKTVCPFCLSYF